MLPNISMRLQNDIYERKAQGRKSFAVLIDPDKVNLDNFSNLLDLCIQHGADYIFVGGSLITDLILIFP
jgi:heptaprenylglyceryl phosphate synthase